MNNFKLFIAGTMLLASTNIFAREGGDGNGDPSDRPNVANMISSTEAQKRIQITIDHSNFDHNEFERIMRIVGSIPYDSGSSASKYSFAIQKLGEGAVPRCIEEMKFALDVPLSRKRLCSWTDGNGAASSCVQKLDMEFTKSRNIWSVCNAAMYGFNLDKEIDLSKYAKELESVYLRTLHDPSTPSYHRRDAADRLSWEFLRSPKAYNALKDCILGEWQSPYELPYPKSSDITGACVLSMKNFDLSNDSRRYVRLLKRWVQHGRLDFYDPDTGLYNFDDKMWDLLEMVIKTGSEPAESLVEHLEFNPSSRKEAELALKFGYGVFKYGSEYMSIRTDFEQAKYNTSDGRRSNCSFADSCNEKAILGRALAHYGRFGDDHLFENSRYEEGFPYSPTFFDDLIQEMQNIHQERRRFVK